MKLVIEGDEGRKSVVPVRDEMTIGRDDGNTVRLPDRNVSRRHARLFRDSGRLLIEDLGSFNGVRVNGRKIGMPTAVQEGDLIEVGDYELTVQGKLDGVTRSNGGHRVSGGTNGGAPAVSRASDVVEAPKLELRDLLGAETPRLFGLSGPVRGKEFYLTRMEVKFGRGGENDLVVDHPSVSRAHARFLLENGHWKVVDDQSANGIRINGKEYLARTLAPGDTIELGQLQFRFCAPGEKFTLPDESAPDESALDALGADDAQAADPRAGSAVRVAAMAVLLLTALAGVWWFLAGRPAKRAPHGETAPFAAAPAVAEPAAVEATEPAPVAPQAPRSTKRAATTTRSATTPARTIAEPATPAAPATAEPPTASAPDEAKEAQATRLAAASNEKLNAHDFEGAVNDARAALELAPTARDTLCTAYHTLGYGFSYLNDDRSAKKYLEQFKPCCASFGESACAQVEEFLAR